MLENYERKLKEKNSLITQLESRINSSDDSKLLEFQQAMVQEIRLMVSTPINSTPEQLLQTLKNLRKDYRRLRGFDSGPE